MKRDLELSKNILIYVEDHQNRISTNSLQGALNVENQILMEHIYLLYSAGLIEISEIHKDSFGTPFISEITRLTWDGHDFICNLKSEKVWNIVKEKVSKSTGALSFEAIKMFISLGIKELLTS